MSAPGLSSCGLLIAPRGVGRGEGPRERTGNPQGREQLAPPASQHCSRRSPAEPAGPSHLPGLEADLSSHLRGPASAWARLPAGPGAAEVRQGGKPWKAVRPPRRGVVLPGSPPPPATCAQSPTLLLAIGVGRWRGPPPSLRSRGRCCPEREFSARGTTAGEVIVLYNKKGRLLGLPPPGALG